MARICSANRPGTTQPEPDAAQAEHRVASRAAARRRRAAARRPGPRGAGASATATLTDELGAVGQELVQRRVEQPDRHRQPVHRGQQLDEVLRAAAAAAARARSPARRRCRARITCSISARRSPRNMCSVRHRPMPCGAEVPGPVGVLGGVGVRPDREPPGRVGVLQQPVDGVDQVGGLLVDAVERGVRARSRGTSPPARAPPATSPANTSTGGAVDADQVALGDRTVADPRRPRRRVDVQGLDAADARLAHAAGDDGGVAGLAAAGGEDARRRRSCLRGRPGSSPCGPGSPARPSAAAATAAAESKTTSPTAAPGDAAIPAPSSVRSPLGPCGSNCGNISCASCAPSTRVSASSIVISCSSTSWVAIRNAAAAVRLPTRVCSIQSFAALDRELDVAQVPVVRLQPPHHLRAAACSESGSSLGEVVQAQRVADAGDDVLALRVRPGSRRRRRAARTPGRG